MYRQEIFLKMCLTSSGHHIKSNNFSKFCPASNEMRGALMIREKFKSSKALNWSSIKGWPYNEVITELFIKHKANLRISAMAISVSFCRNQQNTL